MPNWCENRLEIYCSEKKAKRIQEECFTVQKNGRKLLFDFEKIIPIGEWEYTKALEAWGCKWDCVIDCENYDGERLCIDFMSPWSPPTPIIKAIVEKYKCAAMLHYAEPGVGFRGDFNCSWDKEDNEVSVDLDECHEYSNRCGGYSQYSEDDEDEDDGGVSLEKEAVCA